MVAKSATRLASVTGIRRTSAENGWMLERLDIENAGLDFAKGVLIASGMSVVLWLAVIGAVARLLLHR